MIMALVAKPALRQLLQLRNSRESNGSSSFDIDPNFDIQKRVLILDASDGTTAIELMEQQQLSGSGLGLRSGSGSGLGLGLGLGSGSGSQSLENENDNMHAASSNTSTSNESKDFDIIFMDSVMTIMSGPDATKDLRDRLQFKGKIIGGTGKKMCYFVSMLVSGMDLCVFLLVYLFI